VKKVRAIKSREIVADVSDYGKAKGEETQNSGHS
jgi:hypothetical protein